MEIKLTTRQWDVYNYIKNRNEDNPDCWITKEEIVNGVEGFNFNPSQTDHNQTAYCQLRNDINTLRKSNIIQKTIISSHKGYKISKDKEEFEKYGLSEQARLLRAIKTLYHQRNKIKMDGQLRFVEDGSNGRIVIEAYINE